MARSQRKAGGRGGANKGRSQTKTQSRKAAAPVAEVEVVEESGGMGIDDGIVILTTVVLLTSVLLIDFMMAKYYEAGQLF